MRGSESDTHFANSTANDAAPKSQFMTLPPPTHTGKSSHFRQLVESLLCLALAVMVFRTFEVEGYMISTRSMGPALLGFHKQVVCPTCQYPFAFGVSYQREGSRTISGENEQSETEDFNGQTSERQLCTCPNCGQRAIDISQVPRNQGDQLLVYREAYWQRLPRRWEVIVFRNPYETTQAYVKRLAGLPGETIEIREGDVYANGTLCRKDYAAQNAVRIPVYDHDFEPTDDPEWQSRWQPGQTWKRVGHGFVTQGETPSLPPDPTMEVDENSAFDLKLSTQENPFDWLTYGHYIRSGGSHVTKVKVPELEEFLQWPHNLLPAQFDAKTRLLSIQG
ncbi:MAG: signal peptidase I, partial [Planctomycetaceae bacterium]|nr:signal peptidase I [Planctomycetaceae bacterium]